MNIFALLFMAGLTLKGVVMLIESLRFRLSLRYDTKIISLPLEVDQEDFNPEIKPEMEAVSNSLEPLGKQIYMREAS
jgi:hypothetical protein